MVGTTKFPGGLDSHVLGDPFGRDRKYLSNAGDALATRRCDPS